MFTVRKFTVENYNLALSLKMTGRENETADLGIETEEAEKVNDDEPKLEREKVLLKLKRGKPI